MNKDNITSDISDNLEAGYNKPSRHSKEKNKKKFSKAQKIIISAAIVICVCAAAFGIFSFIQNIDYMRPVKDICSIYNSRETDTDKLFKLIYSGSDKKAYNSAYKIIANSDSYYSYFESIPTQLEDYYRDNAASGGSNIKMKFDITGSKEKMDDSQLASTTNLKQRAAIIRK